MEKTQNRISRERLFYEVLKLISLRSTCKRLQVGALLVNDNRIVAMSYNGQLGLNSDTCSCEISLPCQKAIHAEANLISFCAKKGIVTDSATLWVTHKPCKYCSDLVIQSGISQVYYIDDYRIDNEDYLTVNGVKVNKVTFED